jgi:hypothetical protein
MALGQQNLIFVYAFTPTPLRRQKWTIVNCLILIKPLKLTPISIEFFIPKNGKKKKWQKMATIWQQFDNNLTTIWQQRLPTYWQA